MDNQFKELLSFDKFSQLDPGGSIGDRYAAVRRFFSGIKKVYFEPLSGNHGDELISLGSRKFLADRSVDICTDISSVDWVVINGGGGMMPLWRSFKTLITYVRSGAKKIVILPSTFQLDDTDLELLKVEVERNDVKLKIFCRERVSFQRMSAHFPDVEIAPDMAFYLTPTDLFVPQSSPIRGPFSLVVERRDNEGWTQIARAKNYRIPMKRVFPDSLRRFIKRRVLHGDFVEGQLFKDVRKRWEEGSRWVSLDISDQSLCSFDQFLSYTYFADRVVTTRLHVAILRSIFGKPAILVPSGGDYRKNEAVFEYTLAHKTGFSLYVPI